MSTGIGPLRTIQRRLSRRSTWILTAAAICLVVLPIVQHLTPTISGLPKPRRKIHVVVVTPEQFSERLRAASSKAMTSDLRCQRLALYALGFVQTIEPNLQPKIPGIVDLILGSPMIPAFYVVGSDSIFTLIDNDPSVRHEWVHAIDDQSTTRMEAILRANTTDERLALRAAAEGTAVVALGGRERPLPLSSDLDESSWAIAYYFGPRYVRAFVGRDVERAFALQPSTIREILFHDVTPPVVPPSTSIADEERLLCSDRLGVAGLLVALQKSGASAADASYVAHNWAGDRLDVISLGTGRRYVWSVIFSDSLAAKIWQAGPGVQIPLTTPSVQMHTIVAGVARTPTLLDSLGK